MAGSRSSEPGDGASEALAGEFLRISRHQLRERLRRIETCLSKLSTEQVWARRHEAENATGNLLLHLAGNVRQWIICGIGGAASDRDRDAEFARREPIPPGELLALLKETLDEADSVLARLSSSDLLTKRKIQVYEVTVLHAVFHVVEHFAEHTGQIIWATKRMTGEDLAFYGHLSKPTPPSGSKAMP